jgi:hypothetical protein
LVVTTKSTPVLILLALILAAAPAECLTIVDASEILDKIQRGEPVEYQDSYIKGDISLNTSHPNSHEVKRTDYVSNILLIGGSVWPVNSSINITDSIIDGNVKFGSAEFLKPVRISNSTMKKVDFNGSIFSDIAQFDGSTFNDLSLFSGSNFKRFANFEQSKFNGPSEFEGVTFEKNAELKGAKFNKSATFEGCTFQSYSTFIFSRFDGPANFNYTHFARDLLFDKSFFNQSAMFKNALFKGKASFNNSKFNGPALFSGSNFEDGIYFNYAIFAQLAEFDDVIVDVIDMSTAKLDNLYANWEVVKGKFILNSRNQIEIYEKLRKDYQSSGLSDDANDCYYKIRTIRGDKIKYLPYKILDRYERYSYGYGMKPLYTLGCSLFLIVFFGLIYRIKGTKDPFYFSTNVFLSGTGKLLVNTPKLSEGSSDLERLLYDLERTLGLLFFTLFLITITKAILA